MLIGLVKAFDGAQELIASAILPIIQPIWPVLCAVLNMSISDGESITLVCTLI